MTYSEACEVLRFTTPKSPAENARLARSLMRSLTPNAPLKFKVACQTLINATNSKETAQ